MKKNVAFELFKITLSLVLGCLLWTIIFSITAPDEAEEAVEPFEHAILILGILTGLFVSFILKFNLLNRLKQKLKSSLSNIEVFEEKSTRLLDKANRVADKYMNYEGNVQVEVAKERTGKNKSFARKIHNSSQFQTAIENYPDLKANESIMMLLNQIKECESSIANFKLEYNSSVETYNTMIHSFPTNIMAKIFSFKDEEFYKKTLEEEIVSDEELGI